MPVCPKYLGYLVYRVIEYKFCCFCTKAYVVGTHQNYLTETVLKSTHKMYVCSAKITKNIIFWNAKTDKMLFFTQKVWIFFIITA